MKKIGIILIGIGIILFSCLVFLNLSEKVVFEENKTVFFNKEELKKEAVLIIDFGEGEIRTFNENFTEGMTAFDLLETKTKETGLSLKAKTYDIGILIEAIGGKENGQDEKYWLYYINEEMPMVSADKQELKPGDKVEFKFEESPF